MELKCIRMAAGVLPYYELGKGNDLLFLHGSIATARAYAVLLNFLAQHFHIIAPIHPGHGESLSIPRDWKLVDFVRFYKDVLIELNFSPTILIGHSFGGTVALLLSVQHIGSRVIAMDPPGLPFTFDITQYGKALIAEGRRILRKRPDKERFLELTKAAGTLIQTAVRHPSELSMFVSQGPRLDIYRELKKISVPVELFWGEKDEVVPLAIGQKMIQFIPTAHLTVLRGYEHNYSVTYPEFTYKEIKKILGIMQ
jgi:pimeloyl-ACP methyl ester carboxylesterase